MRNINFVKNVNKLILIPVVIAVVSIIIGIIFGVELDINFKGGSRFTFTYENEIAISDFKTAVEESLGKAVSVSESAGISDATKKMVVSLTGEELLATDVQDKLISDLQEKFADNNIELGDSNTVNPTIARSFFIKAAAAVLVTAVLVILYIGIRFRKIGGVSSGLTALAALVIDCVMAFCACVVLRLPIDMNFVAVILTLLGYSLNDTVVMYDRVRENKSLYSNKSIRELVNMSINQVMARTITTTLTTFVAVMVICVVAEIFGLTTLRTFVAPMAIGLISGCFTSMCISGPLWVKWMEKRDSKPAKAK